MPTIGGIKCKIDEIKFMTFPWSAKKKGKEEVFAVVFTETNKSNHDYIVYSEFGDIKDSELHELMTDQGFLNAWKEFKSSFTPNEKEKEIIETLFYQRLNNNEKLLLELI